MKRNHTTKRAGKSGMSPWARYNKRPFTYSPSYYNWFRDTVGAASKSEVRNNERA